MLLQAQFVSSHLSNLRASLTDTTSLFGGAQATRLVTWMRQQSRLFHRPPIGPLGAVLSLQDERWGLHARAQV